MALLYVGEVMPKSMDALKMRLYVSGSVVAFASALSVGLAGINLEIKMSPKKPSMVRQMASVKDDLQDCPDLHFLLCAPANIRRIAKVGQSDLVHGDDDLQGKLTLRKQNLRICQSAFKCVALCVSCFG